MTPGRARPPNLHLPCQVEELEEVYLAAGRVMAALPHGV
jgi:hypothetical protein